MAPLLFALYFVTMEVSQAIETNKKVHRVGSMVGDLITQQQTINATEVDAIMKIGESTLQPYNRSVGTIIVTAIEITNDQTPKVQVAWSRKLVNGTAVNGLPKDTATSVPEALKIKGTYLIRVESDLAYKPVITWVAKDKPVLGLAAAFDGISMSETYHLRPRMSPTIPCTGC
ncbi:pilus assembly protein [Mesorhizobium sp. ANAO-SY3R2]|uniref:pilus assembly protein n=1 Tax=Mesorhizobium sp. ANAO-SY3R2 TaxID=3166644 RepID=UPI00366CC66A